jgi:hypothetical protein
VPAAASPLRSGRVREEGPALGAGQHHRASHGTRWSSPPGRPSRRPARPRPGSPWWSTRIAGRRTSPLRRQPVVGIEARQGWLHSDRHGAVWVQLRLRHHDGKYTDVPCPMRRRATPVGPTGTPSGRKLGLSDSALGYESVPGEVEGWAWAGAKPASRRQPRWHPPAPPPPTKPTGAGGGGGTGPRQARRSRAAPEPAQLPLLVRQSRASRPYRTTQRR